MKKILSIIMLGLLTFEHAASQTSVWQISNETNKIYLGGSVHILRESDYPLPREFDVAFAKAQTLVFEADINDFGLKAKILTESFLPEGQTLKTILKPEVYENLSNMAASVGIPMSTIEKMKPAVAVMTVSFAKLKDTDATSAGVDSHYYDKAVSNNKKIEFLESIDSQIDLMFNMPIDQDEFINYSLEDLNNIDYAQNFGKMVEEWRGGQPTGADELQSLKEKYPNVYKLMFSDRNNNWMPLIENYLNSGESAFIIVGSAHLWGGDGLLQMLKNKGYKIRQLRVAKRK